MENRDKEFNEILERVKRFCLETGITVSEFERRAGLGNGYFGKAAGSISAQKMRGIVEAFPKLSISWLIGGEGPMLVPDGPAQVAQNIAGHNEQNATAIVETIAHQLEEKDTQIGRLLGIIENLSKD